MCDPSDEDNEYIVTPYQGESRTGTVLRYKTAGIKTTLSEYIDMFNQYPLVDINMVAPAFDYEYAVIIVACG